MKGLWAFKAAIPLLIILGIALPGQAASPRFKMTTAIPPGIAIPDQVETRLGILKFSDGCPDDGKHSAPQGDFSNGR
ncbi:MAG: hypothetical protein JXB25_09640 [Deltaproteobacteria bacterium]|nr:hypothetical protein [Deltaproteobacteria bacterium]